MNEVISTAVNGVEFDPRYSEIEFTLSEFDSQTDPLNAVDNARDINWHAIREQSAALLEQCFDLHVVLWFMRANLHIDGFRLSIKASRLSTANMPKRGAPFSLRPIWSRRRTASMRPR